MDYQDYPVTMTHPHYKPARITRLDDGRPGVPGMGPSYAGTPEAYGPVTARDADEEAYHASQGYVRAGKADPSAYVTQATGAMPAGYEPQEYPKWINYDGEERLVNSVEDDPTLLGDKPLDDLDEGVQGISTVMQDAFAEAEARSLARIRELEAELAEAKRRKGGRPKNAAKADQSVTVG